MQDTRHTEESEKTTETDFDSFYDTQKEFVEEVQHGKTGFARLVDCELVEKSEVPEEYKNSYGNLSENYLVFTAVLGKTDKEVKVVCAAKEDGINLNTALGVTEASSIDDLSGRKVPVQHVGNDIYRVAIFKKSAGSNVDLGGLPITGVKFMLDNNLLEFKNGQWKGSGFINPLFAVSMLMVLPTFAIGAISIFLGGSIGAFIFIGGLSLYIYLVEKYGR